MISGGFVGGGESSSAWKAHLHSIRSANMGEIQAVSKLPRIDTTITFFDSDLEGCQHPHDDPLVVCAIVANTTVHRVLVDNGSSADIIFTSAFDKMGIGREKLEPVNTHLRGFFGERVLPLGSIQSVLMIRPKTWCVKCTPMCASARVAPSNIVYSWYGYRSTGTGVLTTKVMLFR